MAKDKIEQAELASKLAATAERARSPASDGGDDTDFVIEAKDTDRMGDRAA